MHPILEKQIIPDASLLQKEKALEVFRILYLTRSMDHKMQVLVKQNKGTSFFLSTAGHELVGAVASQLMKKNIDWSFPYYRDRAFALGLGCDPVEIMGAFLARNVENHGSGRMMLDHFSDKKMRIPCQSSVVGSQYLQAVGVAKGIKLQGLDEVVYVSSGDGATSQGEFHEALNFAAIHELPVIFVIQDNEWAISVPQREQTAGQSIERIAKGYANLGVFSCDGSQFDDTAAAMQQAFAYAKMQKRPALVVAKVARWNAHTNSDDPTKYKDPKTIEEEKARDPILHMEKWLVQQEFITSEELILWKKEINQQVEQIGLEAEKMEFPPTDSAATRLFEEYAVKEIISPSSLPAVTMKDAINHALIEEMKKDDGIIVFGQDVAHGKGGAFGVTTDLSKYFQKRCFNTPLAEATIIGIAIGLSMDGKHKPIAEIQYADYMWTGVNQLVNELSSIYYRSNGQWNCPIVVRMPYGGYIQGGPYHSQSIEAVLAHMPGLKIVVPSNAADAKRLLKTAIEDPNPVVFLEHKALYRENQFCKKPEPMPEDRLAFGKANILHEGSSITVIAWGMLVKFAYELALQLEKEGISLEVVDLRTLVPYDKETILASVEKTSKVIIAQEAYLPCSFAQEIGSMIMQKAFSYLDAPIQYVGAKHFPIPFAKNLEDDILPQKKDLEIAIRNLHAF